MRPPARRPAELGGDVRIEEIHPSAEVGGPGRVVETRRLEVDVFRAGRREPIDQIGTAAGQPLIGLERQQHVRGPAAVRDEDGPSCAAFLAPPAFWLNSRADMVVDAIRRPPPMLATLLRRRDHADRQGPLVDVVSAARWTARPRIVILSPRSFSPWIARTSPPQDDGRRAFVRAGAGPGNPDYETNR